MITNQKQILWKRGKLFTIVDRIQIRSSNDNKYRSDLKRKKVTFTAFTGLYILPIKLILTIFFSLASSIETVRMPLRATENDHNTLSPLSGIQYFCQDPEKTSTAEWEQWPELFELAMLAKNSISMSEIIRVPTDQEPQNPASLGNFAHSTATKSAVSILCIAIGKTGRKILPDKYPQINIFVIGLGDLIRTAQDVL